jgi:hypothetical protein
MHVTQLTQIELRVPSPARFRYDSPFHSSTGDNAHEEMHPRHRIIDRARVRIGSHFRARL